MTIETAPAAIVPPAYAFSSYDHALISHATWQLRAYGGLMRFGTWHVEHANKWWKAFLQRHTSCGGRKGAKREEQALRRFLLLSDITVRRDMRKDMRLRAPRTCKKCGGTQSLGHARRCPAQFDESAAAAADAGGAGGSGEGGSSS